MADVTRDMLREATINEFGDTDPFAQRILHAIATASVEDVLNADTDDVDEATADDATLVAIGVEYHYGTGWEFVG